MSAGNSTRIRNKMKLATNCFYCGKPFHHADSGLNAGMKTKDHIVPVKIFGENHSINIVITCRWCNEQKGDKTLLEFFEHIEKLGDLSTKNRNSEVILENILHLMRKIEPYYPYLFKGTRTPNHIFENGQRKYI